MAGNKANIADRSLTVGAGVGVLREGFAFVWSRPRMLLFGAVPPLIMSVVTVALLAVIVLSVSDIAAWSTPFADEWSSHWRDPFRVVFSVVLVAASVLVMVMVFSALTLAIGAPIYDKISEAVDDEAGGVSDQIVYPARVWVPRVIGQAIVTLCQSVAVGLLLFVIGVFPVVGGVIAAVLGAIFGGMLVARELISTPAEKWGLPGLGERRRLLSREPGFTLGFGIPVYFLLSIPFVSVAVFPAAVAGATILIRRILRQPWA